MIFFSVRIDFCLFFLCPDIEIDLIFRVGTKMYFISVMGSKLTWFSFAESKLTRFYLASGSNLTCLLRWGQNRFRFCVRAENYMGYLKDRNWLVFLAWRSKWTWFLCAGRE